MSSSFAKYRLAALILLLGLSLAVFAIMLPEQKFNNNQLQSPTSESKEDKELWKENKKSSPTKTEREKLILDLKAAADKENYAAFAESLKLVYAKKWEKYKDFEKIESEAYVYADKNYFLKGDLDRSLLIATTVYEKVSSSWRFAYLRILTLEKLGRNAFVRSDLAKAEQYALTILAMSFRPEGANLLADVYSKKIEADIAAGDTAAAKKNLDYIAAFELGSEQKARLNVLRDKLN